MIEKLLRLELALGELVLLARGHGASSNEINRIIYPILGGSKSEPMPIDDLLTATESESES